MKNKWTEFWDMSSGGSQKEDFDYCYIEAPEEEAKIIFYNRFGHNPDRVSCTCCGSDYSISESETLEHATGYHRGCRSAYFKGDIELSEEESRELYFKANSGLTWKYIEEPDVAGYTTYQTIPEFEQRKDVMIIYAKDIKPEERIGELPEEGYIWH